MKNNRTTETSSPIGAAMVVGGGIAGMQASLDLADQGFKVFLVEKQSAIGGKMAQLDKTFPTNDCAMCTISPKLVETSRHPNIQILTNTEVQEIQGAAGNFTVKVKQHPRYIDPEKSVTCGDCASVCPVITPNQFNENLSQQRAAYKLYPQAVPNAYAIQKKGIAPCRDACPAGQRAQGYIALIREGRWDDALRVIKMDNPFPGICGRICNHRCESACNRGLVDEPINIRALKRFVTDKVYANPRVLKDFAPVLHNEKVAIIGAGPCGLTAAQDLRYAGYQVTIFEAMPVAGGMLRLGVPEYRLPTNIIEREVQDILDLGIDLRLNHRVSDLDDLFEQGFSAVLISVGAHEGIRLPIPGADLNGVLINTHFLRDVRLGLYTNGGNPTQKLGKNVLVLGGGNVAIDCARSARRLGSEVHLACLESREQMPAHEWEVQAAVDEGVHLHCGRSFEKIIGDPNSQVVGLECQHVKSFKFDSFGQLHLEKEPESAHLIPCDTIIFSVGQRAGLAFIPDDAGVGITKKQTIAINPNTFAATRPGVFAAGDSVSGTAFVIEAVASGHKAAESIDRYLRKNPLEPPASPELPVVKFSTEEIQEKLAKNQIHIQPRIQIPELPVSERFGNFEEVEFGYTDELAQLEASRCLACGICSECMSCTFVCGAKAIDHNMVAKETDIDVGAVILAPGYQIYKAELSAEYGFGRFPNVVSALQYERLLSASGPTMGHVERPSDHKKPKRIAFLQCVGSRDQSHDYCSAVCCMYATKEAIMTKEHYPDLDIHVFMMDMRAFSKGYWDYFERAKGRYGIQYTRCRISAVREDPSTHDLWITFQDELFNKAEEKFDLVVLSVGMEISKSVQDLGSRLGIELDEYGFCHTPLFNPIESSRPGIYAVGPFREPKDIPESVVEASGAAAAAAARLSSARFSLTTPPVYPPEKDISEETAKIGVFVCHCGSNIAGYMDINTVTSYAETLPSVTHAESNLYTCSQDSIKHITQQVKDLGLNRVVVASCTPLTHQPLFQDSIRSAGLNPYLFEMANIRNQCSWVHSNDKATATSKAKELIRMAVARAQLLEPQNVFDVPVEKTALVVGGGAAGMTSALSLADQGFPVHLVEKENELGGNLRHVFTTTSGKNPQEILHRLTQAVFSHPKIEVHLNSEVVQTSGFMGNFTTTIRKPDLDRYEIKHGATVLAIGAQEYRGNEYDHGHDQSVITQQKFETILNQSPEALNNTQSIVMLQCVGPGQDYCSRICCSVALKNAVHVKEKYPDKKVVVLYKDIRSYGFKERLYTEARRRGVIFIRYTKDLQPQITQNNPITVRTWEANLNTWIEIQTDLLVLSMPVVPGPDASKIAALFKVPLDSNGFYLESHVKLRPVDFNTDGIFMAGMAHYPKLVDETMIQAQAAAARAARVLSKDTLKAGGRIAVVDANKCTGCLTCVRICPFNVPKIQPNLTGIGNIMGAAFIEPAICQGCGTCASECPAQAIQLMHYTDIQMNAKVDALLQPEAVFVPIEDVNYPAEANQ